MNKVKMIFSTLFLLLLILCSGCGSGGISDKEGKEDIAACFEQADTTELHARQEQNDLSIELNHVVFEENLVILDYTLKSADLSQYEDVLSGFRKEDLENGDGYTVAVKEEAKEKRIIAYLDVTGGVFSHENVGEDVEIIFSSLYGEEGSGIDMTFPVKIEEVFMPTVAEAGQEFSCADGAVLVKSIVISKFHTDVHMDITDCPTFMEKFYGWEITDESGKVLQWISGSGETYNYSALPESCKELKLSLIKYKEDNSYEKIGDTVTIPMR